MTSANSASEEGLRQAFRYFNHFMLFMWRAGLGRWINVWPEGIGRIMVLTTTGRKSGLPRRTPVNYAIVDGEVYCTAAFGPGADWYRNLRADPRVEVWLPDGWWEGEAEEVTDSARRLPLLREVLIASAFAGRAAGIDAQQMRDAELDKLTREYRLIRIRRGAARTGTDGPGDLAWVWPVATTVLALMLLMRPRRKR
jgi:deazaflavin-dependent oxidoreductase (nitroreductase family)